MEGNKTIFRLSVAALKYVKKPKQDVAPPVHAEMALLTDSYTGSDAPPGLASSRQVRSAPAHLLSYELATKSSGCCAAACSAVVRIGCVSQAGDSADGAFAGHEEAPSEPIIDRCREIWQEVRVRLFYSCSQLHSQLTGTHAEAASLPLRCCTEPTRSLRMAITPTRWSSSSRAEC